jgi:four helix bundle protein
MKLEVWNDAVELFGRVNAMLSVLDGIDFKLKSQILDAAQSISANISEGYSRRTVNEYLQFLNISLGSCGELMTRMIGLKKIGKLSNEQFESFDEFHYRVENKLLALVKSLQAKRGKGIWDEEIHESQASYHTASYLTEKKRNPVCIVIPTPMTIVFQYSNTPIFQYSIC